MAAALRATAVPARLAAPTPAGARARPVAAKAVPAQGTASRLAAAGAAASTLLAAGNAHAAAEVATLAAGDGRLGIIGLLFAPVLGWVLFNIGQPALNQLEAMSGDKPAAKARKGRAAAVGLGLTAASLMAAQSADAATDVATLAAGDGRVGIIALLFLPVLGWVAFNIAGPFLNQLAAMSGDKPTKSAGKRKGRAAAAGLGLTAASLLAAQSADAATELATVAAGDGRVGIIALLFAPVLGWVAFNIAGPFLNQLSAMDEKKGAPAKKGGRR